MAAWKASIDPRLVARLVRPVRRPGVIRMVLARRILAGVTAMADRLPLLRRFGERRDLVANTPIVHARWLPAEPFDATPTAAAIPAIVHATASHTRHTIERVVVRGSGPAVPGGAVIAASRGGAQERAIERPLAVVQVAPDRVAEPVVVTPAAHDPGAARAGGVVPAAVRPARPGTPTATLAAVQPAEVGGSAPRGIESGPGAARRSRVGSPLSAGPLVAPRPVSDAPAARRAAVPSDTGTAAPGIVHTAAAPDGRPPRSPAQAPGATGARTLARVTPRAVRAEPHTEHVARAAMPLVHARPLASGPIAAPASSLPVVAPAVVPRGAVVEARARPLVEPVRPIEAARARGATPALLHPSRESELVAAAEPAIARAPAPSTTPPVSAAPAPPPLPTPPAIDLPRLAEQVQRILLRQAAHTRARQGGPR